MKKENFFERVKHSPRPVVVDFWAPWCGPCRAIEPALKKLGAEYAGRVDVWKVNADEQPEVLRSLRVYGIPTLIAFRGGREVARHTGAASPAALSTLFESALSGRRVSMPGPAPVERLVRLAAGAALVSIAFQAQFAGLYLALAGLGAVVAFTAVYDRCPVYRAISSRVKSWLRPQTADQAG